MPKEKPTQEELNHYLFYNPETGYLRWKNPLCKRLKPGDVAGVQKERYVELRVNGVHMQAHVAIWCMVYGYYPVEVDHIDRNGLNNRLDNLREANRSLNCLNTSKQTNNSSGIKGVYWHKKNKKWVAKLAGKYLGSFDEKSVAEGVYIEAFDKALNDAADALAKKRNES